MPWKKRDWKKRNKVFERLLDLLRAHPEFVREMVLDSLNLEGLLNDPATAKQLDADTRKFLQYVASTEDGYGIVQFLHNTSYVGMCAKGTMYPSCLKGTTPSGPAY